MMNRAQQCMHTTLTCLAQSREPLYTSVPAPAASGPDSAALRIICILVLTSSEGQDTREPAAPAAAPGGHHVQHTHEFSKHEVLIRTYIDGARTTYNRTMVVTLLHMFVHHWEPPPVFILRSSTQVHA